jgi:hypothetical protein
MRTRLNLTLNKTVAESAKQYAEKTGRSLSQLVETYLEGLVETDAYFVSNDLPPKLKKLFGSVKISADLDHKQALRETFNSRYIK